MHPKQLTKFRAWAKAMEANATVDKPDYGKTQAGSVKVNRRRNRRRKRRSLRRSRRKNAQAEA